RDRTLTEKCPDPVCRGADLGERCLRAVGCDQAAALQQFASGDELGIDPGCRVIHGFVSSYSAYSAARAGRATGVDVAAGSRGRTSLASSLMPFSASR